MVHLDKVTVEQVETIKNNLIQVSSIIAGLKKVTA